MKVAVLQSNYIPWKGYFDLIRQVDLFVFYDNVQYTKNDWRNRNKIKTAQGLKWLTVPCGSNIHRLIKEVTLEDPSWQARHWDALRESYYNAPYFGQFRSFLEDVYKGHQWKTLSEMNQYIIRTICTDFLGLTTRFADADEWRVEGARQDRLLDLLKKVGATFYLSGPSAKDYIQPAAFEQAGIQLDWMQYGPYPEYTQLHPPFVHEVSILDLLFHTGPQAIDYISMDKPRPA